MMYSARLQFLTCLVMYATSAHAIMVKFGTRDGPIEPSPPETTIPPPQSTRIPAPVWEERSNDTPDPNAHWRPQLFVPQPRYTTVVYSADVGNPTGLTNVQRFVISYLPIDKTIHVKPIKDHVTSEILSSQNIPGYGIVYFVPKYATPDEEKKQDEVTENAKKEDVKLDKVETNDISEDVKDVNSDEQWKQEKDAAKRTVRTIKSAAVYPFVYQWPAYVPRRI